MGFSGQKYWSGLQFPPAVDHVLSELFTVTRPSQVALHGMLIASLSYASPFDMTNTGLLKDFPEMFAKMALNSKLSPNYAALFWHSSDTSDYRSFTRFGYRRVKE